MNKVSNTHTELDKNVYLPASSPLSAKEQADLKDCEKIISNNYHGAFALAKALHQIRDKKLYRADYKTFESYCTAKWEYSRSYCHRLISMDEVVTDLKQEPNDKTAMIRNEGQARVFVDLASSDRIKLLNKARERVPTGNITAKALTELKNMLFPHQCANKHGKATSETSVLDVEATETTPIEVKLVENMHDAAKDLFQGLADCDEDDSEIGKNLRIFINTSEKWLAYHKDNQK